MLLRPAAQPSGAVVAVAPIVARHIRPLQHAVLAPQFSGQLQHHIVPARRARCQRILAGAILQWQHVLLEALVALDATVCVQIAQFEDEPAQMVGGKLHTDRQQSTGRVRFDDDTLAVLAAQLVRPWCRCGPVVAAQATAAAVLAELNLRMKLQIQVMSLVHRRFRDNRT